MYLADLAYGERHAGETYTGASWQFHHFGPWAAEVFERIEPALQAAGAEMKRITSRYADDFIRYRFDQDDAERIRSEAERMLPMTVQASVGRAVHEFGSDTASLLRAVYLSAPMVNAAPEEILDFGTVVRETRAVYEAPPAAQPTKATKKRRQQRIAEIRDEVQRRLGRQPAAAAPQPLPRYDEVFNSGVRWLDDLAGEPVPSTTGELTVAPDVWKSETRREPDVS